MSINCAGYSAQHYNTVPEFCIRFKHLGLYRHCHRLKLCKQHNLKFLLKSEENRESEVRPLFCILILGNQEKENMGNSTVDKVFLIANVGLECWWFLKSRWNISVSCQSK